MVTRKEILVKQQEEAMARLVKQQEEAMARLVKQQEDAMARFVKLQKEAMARFVKQQGVVQKHTESFSEIGKAKVSTQQEVARENLARQQEDAKAKLARQQEEEKAKLAKQQEEERADFAKQLEKQMFTGVLAEILQNDQDPSVLLQQIAKAGFDSDALLKDAQKKCAEEMRERLNEQYSELISNLLKNNPKASLQDTIAWFESQQEDVEIDLVTEAYNKTISSFKRDYQHVVEMAARIMRLEDVDAGIAYINKYENISIIAACAGETVSDCIKTAKGRVVKQYEGEINAENKKLSKYVILLLVGVGVLVYGLCKMSYFLIIIGAIVAIIYVRKFPKYMQKKKMLKMLIEKK